MTVNLDQDIAFWINQKPKDIEILFRRGLINYISDRLQNKIETAEPEVMTIDLLDIRQEISLALAKSFNKYFESAPGNFYFDRPQCTKKQRKQWLKILRGLQVEGLLEIINSKSWHEHTVKIFFI